MTITDSLLSVARKRRLRALRHLHHEGMTLSNIFDLRDDGDDRARRPATAPMFERLHPFGD